MLPVIACIILFLLVWELLIVAEPIALGGAGQVAKLTAKIPYRDYLPLIVLLLVGGGLTAWVGDQFTDLAELVVAKNAALQSIDQTWHDSIIFARSPGATTFFTAMTIIGGPVSLGLVTGVVAGALFIRKHSAWAAYLLVTAGGGALLDMELKRYFERARPALAEALRRASGYSFPSGHAMGSTVVAGALTYLAVLVLHTWRQKAATIAFAVTLVAAVAASRVYLGVHWISDIIAGVTAGLMWLFTTTIGYETFRRVHALRQKRA